MSSIYPQPTLEGQLGIEPVDKTIQKQKASQPTNNNRRSQARRAKEQCQQPWPAKVNRREGSRTLKPPNPCEISKADSCWVEVRLGYYLIKKKSLSTDSALIHTIKQSINISWPLPRCNTHQQTESWDHAGWPHHRWSPISQHNYTIFEHRMP